MDIATILAHGRDGALAEMNLYFAEFFFGTFFPAFIFAAAIKCFVRERALTRWLGPRVSPLVSYPVALVSGLLFSVCACGVLPLFASVHRHGAGIGPATAFLVAGPAINLTAIVLTWPFFGFTMTALRTLGTLAMAIVIGLLFGRLFGEERRGEGIDAFGAPSATGCPACQTTGSVPPAAAAPPAEAPAEGDDLLDPAYNYLEDRELDEANIPKPWWQVALIFGVTFAYMTVGPIDFSTWFAERRTGVLLKVFLLYGYSAFLILFTLLALDRGERRDWLEVVGHFIWKISWPLVVGLAMLGFVKGNMTASLMHRVMTDWMGPTANPLGAVFLSSLIAVPSYFGTCVSVVYVKLFVDFGMAPWAALAMFLGGPTFSVASFLPLGRILGWRRATLLAGLIFAGTVLLSLASIPIFGR